MRAQWSKEEANAWYQRQGWLCGFNYLPRTAVNWNELWQAETFDIATIDEELGWAEDVGYNTLRVNLPFIVWLHDREGLFARIDAFLSVAQKHGMQVMLTLMDDCGFSGDEPHLGLQEAPIPGVHNSRAVASPGRDTVCNLSARSNIERYIHDVITTFRADGRILLWDLYNEPGNRGIFISGADEALYAEKLEVFALEVPEQIEHSGKTYSIEAKLKKGIDTTMAKKVIKLIKDSKLKVQTQIQGEQVRVTGKSRDDLQGVMALIRGADLGQPFQFNNFRD
jgi:hypothetical protein